MPDARPITVQVTVTVTALVYPEPEAGGFSAEVPALPGCYTEGETLDEVRENLKEAAEAWMAAAHEAAECECLSRAGTSRVQPRTNRRGQCRS